MLLSRLRLFIAVVVSLAAAAAVTGALTTAHAATRCQAAYSVTSQWTGGFTANVSLTNLGDPVTSWALTWSFGAGQQVTQAWNATIAQNGAQVTARNASWNGGLATNAGTSFGFNGSWNNSGNPVPADFALNGVTCTSGTGQPTATPTVTPTSGPEPANSVGFIGCSMAENVAQGYVAIGGKRMWGPYGTGGLVVQSWTDPNSSAWQKFDQQVSRFGRPTAVWVQICVFNANATYDEVKRLIANARLHAASGAKIFITGQPLYDAGQTCFLAGANGPQLTDSLARQAATDTTQNVTYAGSFRLRTNEVADGCHANAAGQQSLGRQAQAFWG
ncbi:cellulose-binding domain-containing protein [Nonomuraea sp. CA-143628]|uniref:cellulose-binding domain-containing protein n=1 Tax=Nonomuraea sp. CA-143628 TaxID=3239997 RepID=UPI003D93CE1C